MTDLLLLLAQASQPTKAPPPSGWEVFFRQMFPLFLVVGIFWWWISRSKSKERKTYEDMLSNLKRNDRVQTIGGILGTVVEVRDNEVVLKVDESSNVKMRFNRAAIKEVLRETAETN
ncbi:MAG: preprotein translocase subunit YajC [Phycisphaerae bacterium]|jgi:preprotein translocase subunit YajC